MADVRGGSEVEIRGRFNVTPPTLGDGVTGEVQLDNAGNLKAALASGLNLLDVQASTDGMSTGAAVLGVNGYSFLYGGQFWDRAKTIEAVLASPTAKRGIQAIGLTGWDGLQSQLATVRAIGPNLALATYDAKVRNLLEELSFSIKELLEGLQSEFIVNLKKTTYADYSIYSVLSAATTNADVISDNPLAVVNGWYIFNTSASTKFIKLYNKYGLPNVGTDLPQMRIPIPAGGGANVEFEGGIQFTQGIAIAMTGAVADSDTTALAANDLVVNIFYKEQ
jgi:hypothetical protein